MKLKRSLVDLLLQRCSVEDWYCCCCCWSLWSREDSEGVTRGQRSGGYLLPERAVLLAQSLHLLSQPTVCGAPATLLPPQLLLQGAQLLLQSLVEMTRNGSGCRHVFLKQFSFLQQLLVFFSLVLLKLGQVF
ncbi:hypothetical protein INR49_026977 [Caranx melampygus]|nr:hypothetical protein INR49_026977 [Caranx melampygus]